MKDAIKHLIKRAYEKTTKYIPHKTYIKIRHYWRLREIPNLKNPKTYNEKLQYLKLIQTGEPFTTLSDKYASRKYVADKIGRQYLAKILLVVEDAKDIPFKDLPQKYVIKCNHGSGYNIIVKDKNKLNEKETIKKLNRWMKSDFWLLGRELIYKDIKKKIYIEEYLADNITDYKFFCFDGEPKMMFIATDRGIGTKFDFFDINFNHMPFKQGYPNNPNRPKKPKKYKEMIELSKKLSKGLKHVRVDFYEVQGRIYFGEITFYQFSGWTPFEPKKYDYVMGEMIQLEK